MNSETAVIRPGRTEDLEAIRRFQVALYPELEEPTGFVAAFYRWKYFDLAGRDTGYPSCFVAWVGDQVAGFMGCLPFQLRHGEETVPAGWIADWHVADWARGRGLGQQLLREAVQTVPTLACVNGTADAERVFAREGFVAWEAARSWLRVEAPLAYEWPRRSGWRRVRAAVPWLRRVCASWRRRPDRGAWELRESDPAAWERQCSLADARGGDGLRREAGYLAWIRRAPSAQVRAIVLSREGVEQGYALVASDRDRLGRRRGRILELWTGVSEGEARAGAYEAVADHLARVERVHYLELRAGTEEDSPLRSAGFERRGGDRLWLKSRALTPGRETRWRLSLIDKDDAFRGLKVIP